MSDRDSILLILDMLESAERILQYTESMSYYDFIHDPRTFDAVIRNFEIIGEAANQLPESIRNDTAQIPWNEIRGFRNKIVHNYFGIDPVIVWTIISDFLPDLISQLKVLLP